MDESQIGCEVGVLGGVSIFASSEGCSAERTGEAQSLRSLNSESSI